MLAQTARRLTDAKPVPCANAAQRPNASTGSRTGPDAADGKRLVQPDSKTGGRPSREQRPFTFGPPLAPLGGVERPRRMVRFARLIHRPVRVLGGPAARAACGGNLNLPDCHPE